MERIGRVAGLVLSMRNLVDGCSHLAMRKGGDGCSYLVHYFSHLPTISLSEGPGGWSQPSCPAAGLNCSESLINFSAETEDISWLRASFGRSKGGDRLSQNLSNLIYSLFTEGR